MEAKQFLKEKGISNSDFMDSGVADLIETLLTEYQALQLQQGGVSGSFSIYIFEMEKAILKNLSNLEKGYGRRKKIISQQTGIAEDVLTVLLRRLKLEGKVELIMIWSESKGTPNGSGYCLTGNLG